MATRTNQGAITEQGPLEKRILSHLRSLPANQPVNQRQLALRLGELTSTVHYAVARLEQRGYIEQVHAPGRAKPIRLVPGRVLTAGLAIDSGYLRLAVLNLREEVAAEHAQPQPNEPGLTLAAFLDRAERVLRDTLRRAGQNPASLAAICVAVNGLVDEATGMVIESSTFGWQDVPLGSALSHRLGCAVLVLGTSSLQQALSEAVTGVGRGYESMLYYRVGDGISARMVSGGKLLQGAFGYAGELGHIPVAPAGKGAPCPVCGSPSCLELHAAGPALASQYAQALKDAPAEVPPPELFARLVDDDAAGNKAAQRILDRALDLWTVGLQIALNAYDTPVVALGGWCFKNHPPLVRRLADRVRTSLFKATHRPVHIAPAIIEPARRDLAAAIRAMQDLLGALRLFDRNGA